MRIFPSRMFFSYFLRHSQYSPPILPYHLLVSPPPFSNPPPPPHPLPYVELWRVAWDKEASFASILIMTVKQMRSLKQGKKTPFVARFGATSWKPRVHSGDIAGSAAEARSLGEITTNWTKVNERGSAWLRWKISVKGDAWLDWGKPLVKGRLLFYDVKQEKENPIKWNMCLARRESDLSDKMTHSSYCCNLRYLWQRNRWSL